MKYKRDNKFLVYYWPTGNSKILPHGVDTGVCGGGKKWIGLWEVLDGLGLGLRTIVRMTSRILAQITKCMVTYLPIYKTP